MDPLIAALIQQDMTKAMIRLNAIAERQHDQSAHIVTASSQMFVLSSQMVNAGAMNRVPSGLPQQVLEHNAAGGQPFNSPMAPGSSYTVKANP